MADEYSKYKLFRKYKTEDGVNYTPLDEYQALYESGDGVDCSCGYREYDYKWDGECMCGKDIDVTYPTLTINSVEGDWLRDGYTFTSNTISDAESTLERIYFSVSEPTTLIVEYTQSSENYFDYMCYSPYLDAELSIYALPPNTKGEINNIFTYDVKDTKEHFIDLEYRKDFSHTYNDDNIIVTLSVDSVHTYEKTYEYEVWKEMEYCPNNDEYDKILTNNVEYRNPKQSCKCGYREYEYRDSGELINGEDVPDSWVALSKEYPGSWASFKYVRIDTNNYSFIPSDEINDDYVYFYIDDYSSYKRRYGISISEGKLYDNGYEINIKDLKEIEEGVYEYSFSTSLMFYMEEEKEDDPIYYNKRNNLALKHIYCNSNSGDYHRIYDIYMKQYEYEFCPSDSSYDKKTGNEQLKYYGNNEKYCIETKDFLSSTTGTYADYEVENGVYVTYYSGHTKSSSSSSSRKIEGDFIDTINTDAYQGYFYINFKTKTNKIVFTNIDGGDSKQYSNYSYIFVDGVKIMSYYLKQFVVYLEGDENTIHKIECGQSGSYNMGKWMFNAVREGYNYQMDVFSYKDCSEEIIEMGKNYKEIV